MVEAWNADQEVIPVLAETAEFTKRVVETGRTLIHKTVSERDEVVEGLLQRQDIEVDRIAVGRVVEQTPPPRQEGDTWVFPVMEEVLVVEKRLILKEELHIRTVTTNETVRQTVKLRTEQVVTSQSPNLALASGVEKLPTNKPEC